MDNLYWKMSRRRRQGEGGFTLIELLVVIAVLAILAAIVLFNVLGVTNRGSNSACQTDTKTIQTAVDAAISDNKGSLPAGLVATSGGSTMASDGDLTWLNSNGYLHSVPSSCSASWTMTSQNGGYEVVGTNNGNSYNG